MRRYLYTLLVLILMLASLPMLVQAQANRDDILFVSERDGNREIYAMRSDGSNIRRLTDHPAEDVSPSWSPDKTRIAFASRRGGDFDIYIMDNNGKIIRQLTRDHGTFNDSPTWSPDGTQIAFISNRSGTPEIFVVNVNGGTPRQITRSALGEQSEALTPAWSPDGGRIAYISDYKSSALMLRVVDLNGRELFTYRDMDADAEAVSPSWSGDGRLAFGVNGDGYADIIVLDANNWNNSQSITSINDVRLRALSWSPNGQELVYVSGNRRNATISVINVSGQGIRQLLSNETILTASWGALPRMAPVRVDAGGSSSGGGSGGGGSSSGGSSGGGGSGGSGSASIVRTPPPFNQRTVAPSGAVRLNNGRGLGNGARQDNGNFQVENYCSNLWRNDFDWFCGSRRLEARDFDTICQRTYNNRNAFAIRDGNNRIVAFNWRCYAFPVQSPPEPPPVVVAPVTGERLCPNSPPPRLRVGDVGYVTYGYGPSNLNRYPRRSRNNNVVVDILSEGSTFTVIDGPVCGDGLTWWRIRRTTNSFLGWIAEGQGNIYWLDRR